MCDVCVFVYVYVHTCGVVCACVPVSGRVCLCFPSPYVVIDDGSFEPHPCLESPLFSFALFAAFV
jgi:hypothetical protein